MRKNKFYVKNSSDITKRGAAETNKKSAVEKEGGKTRQKTELSHRVREKKTRYLSQYQ